MGPSLPCPLCIPEIPTTIRRIYTIQYASIPSSELRTVNGFHLCSLVSVQPVSMNNITPCIFSQSIWSHVGHFTFYLIAKNVIVPILEVVLHLRTFKVFSTLQFHPALSLNPFRISSLLCLKGFYNVSGFPSCRSRSRPIFCIRKAAL